MEDVRADENFEKGSSIATQIERANAYAVIHNLKIDKEVSESISGSIRFANRPLGLEMNE